MSKCIDLSGRSFGSWTVLSRAPSQNGRTTWNCQCICGVTKDVSSISLRKGTSTSCGCSHSKENLVGRNFGELTVLSFDGFIKGNPKWICTCSCGSVVSLFENSLRSGRKHCNSYLHNPNIGLKYGKLTITPHYISTGRSRKYLCQCDCGNTTYSTISNLISGNTKSCGCMSLESRKSSITHGMSGSRIYNIWQKMISRCERPGDPSFKKYGAKGITVCESWHDFNSFYSWSISNGYSDALTIDRKDGALGYCPENCRWATYHEQANNTKSNVLYYYNGHTYTLAELAREYNLPYKRLHQRVRVRGWSLDRALSKKEGE